jgi:zinc finger SWIM domain-containing protein 3
MAASIKFRTISQLNTKYHISVTRFDNDFHTDHYFLVIFSHTDQSVSCSCNKFERLGTLCGHALKVLDVMDIKLLTEKYIIQRWS